MYDRDDASPHGIDAAEQKRLEALARYDIMDSEPEPDYDALTILICEIVGADFAMINFLDTEHTWVKSAHGIAPGRLDRQGTVCNFVLADSDDLFEVADLARDARTCHLALGKKIISYVGMPLRAHTGERIGVLAMGFTYTKKLDARERHTLVTLRRQIEVMLERRRALIMVRHQQRAISRLAEQHELLLGTVSRDTRNLLAGILSNCEFAVNLFDERSEEAREAIQDALSAARHARHMLQHIDDSKRRFREETPLALKAIAEVS